MTMDYDERVEAALAGVEVNRSIEEFVADGAEMVGLVYMSTADQVRYAWDPSQARVPKGHPDGGQWTDDGSEYLSAIGPGSPEFPYEDSKAWLEDYDGNMFATIHELKNTLGDDANYTTNSGEAELEAQLENSEDDFIQAVWGDNGLPTAPQAKRGVEQLIGAHLEQQFTFDELAEMALLLGVHSSKLPVDPKDTARLHPDTTSRDIANAIADRVTHQWAMSSGDSNAWSVLMQDAIRQEFDLDDAAFDHLNNAGVFGKNGVDHAWDALFLNDRPNDEKFNATVRPQRTLITRVLRAHARAQYTETQKVLVAADIDSVDLVRGAGLRQEYALDIARTGQVLLQPASSFSTDFTVARGFSGVGYTPGATASTVIRSRVPRHRILSFPRTGFGALNEAEVVVLGGKMKARIMYWLD